MGVDVHNERSRMEVVLAVSVVAWSCACLGFPGHRAMRLGRGIYIMLIQYWRPLARPRCCQVRSAWQSRHTSGRFQKYYRANNIPPNYPLTSSDSPLRPLPWHSSSPSPSRYRNGPCIRPCVYHTDAKLHNTGAPPTISSFVEALVGKWWEMARWGRTLGGEEEREV